MRNEYDSSVEGLFWGRLARPTLFPVQLARSRARFKCMIFLLVSNERRHFGDKAQPSRDEKT